MASSSGHAATSVSREKRSNKNHLILTDRVYEHGYLRRIVAGVFERAQGVRLKADNAVLNLGLLSLMLDLRLFEQYSDLLNLPFVQRLHHANDTRQLQVEVANMIHEFDRKNATDASTRMKVEELLFECST